jgi:hypothetical protein
MHLILCDGCLDARLARPEPAPARAVSQTAAGGFGAEWLRALTGNLGRASGVALM